MIRSSNLNRRELSCWQSENVNGEFDKDEVVQAMRNTISLVDWLDENEVLSNCQVSSDATISRLCLGNRLNSRTGVLELNFHPLTGACLKQ